MQRRQSRIAEHASAKLSEGCSRLILLARELQRRPTFQIPVDDPILVQKAQRDQSLAHDEAYMLLFEWLGSRLGASATCPHRSSILGDTFFDTAESTPA